MTRSGGNAFTVPRDPGSFTADWLTAALASEHPGSVVGAFSVLEETVGVTVRHRLRLAYEAGAGPDTIFIKSTTDDTNDALFGAQEALLYRGAAPLPLEMPRCYASAVDERGRSVIVLEDLTTRGATMNLATGTFGPEAAARGLEGLAALHGRYWGTRLRTASELRWVQPFKYDLLREASAQLMPVVATRSDELGLLALLPSRLHDPAILASWWGLPPAPGARTVVHGDPHVGNTYTLANGTIGFLDWQLISESSWEHDVGYFLIGSLDVEDRRRDERALLEHYLAHLAATGADAPTFEEAWTRYRQTPAYGLLVWLITATTTTAHLPAVCAECTVRFATAFEELETEQAWMR